MRSLSKPIVVFAMAGLAAVTATHAVAQDFFSFFGGGQYERPTPRMPYADEGDFNDSPRVSRPQPPRPRSVGVGQSYCVRTCDGRYFPISSGDGASSRLATCKSLCPASETKIYSGSLIDNASAGDGKSYVSLPNAFRYRKELVAGCTCNGKNQLGLAPISPEDDPTIRKGDIIAKGGLSVRQASDPRGASLRSGAINGGSDSAPVLASGDR